jgi:signal transduction histidine kinase
MMATTLRALLIEDSPDDALLIERALRRGGYDLTAVRVDNAASLRAALAQPVPAWDVVISDYGLPGFSALEALQIVRSTVGEDVPFVIVSGSIGEESAVEALKAGAGDFIVKNNLDRLLTALDRELRDAQTRRERRDAVAALQEAVRARDEFLAIASHELRTPLTSLQLQLQRLWRKTGADGASDQGAADAAGAPPMPTGDLRARLRLISRSADRLQALVERLLDVTRLTTVGRIELLVDDADLSELVRAAVRRMLATESEGPTGPIAVRAPAPVVGRWDAQRLETVIVNLLDNALKYGRGRAVDVSVESTAEGGRVTVVDQGIGIPPEDQRRIFERFERAVPIHHFGGFGLGLWLSQQIAKAHGGRIKVESRPGEGSTFVLELPRTP